MIRTLATGAVLVVLGVVLTGLGVHQLGVVRAARKWPSAPQPRIGRGLSAVEVAGGLAAIAGGAVVLATRLPFGGVAELGACAGAAVFVLVLGMIIAAKVADRVELNALIRSPSPLYRTTAPRPGGPHQTATFPSAKTSPPGQETDARTGDADDPVVPDGVQPGWVLTDPDGGWYLCVITTTGRRLVRLPDFRLEPPGAVGSLGVAGTVELSVWPLDATEEGPPAATESRVAPPR